MKTEDTDTGLANMGAAVHVQTARDFSYVRFISDPQGFKTFLTNALLTDNGKTVGERNREWLHEKLDEWIEGNLK